MPRSTSILLTLFFSASIFGQLTLDQNFNAGVTEGYAEAYASAVQPDGKILIGGQFTADGRVNLVRVNPDGSPDPTFVQLSPLGLVTEIKTLPDGKVLIGGTMPRGITRLNPDGSADPTFNPGGSGATGPVAQITIQPDGKILVSGQFQSYNGGAAYSVLRLNADGTPDTGFTSPFPPQRTVRHSAVQSDGKIIVCGNFLFETGPYYQLARLNSDGTLDASFNSGSFTTDFAIISVYVDPLDRPIIVGLFGRVNETTRHGIARLNPNGSLDATFDPQVPEYTSVYSAALKPDGKIVIAGYFRSLGVGANQPPVIQLNTDGTLDESFHIPVSNDMTVHVALDNDGRILLSGYFSDLEASGQGRQCFARLNPDGTVDDTMSGVGIGLSGRVEAMIQQTDGKYVVIGDFYRANGIPHRSITRFNADGTADDTFQTGWGFWPWVNVVGGYNFKTVLLAEHPGGKLLVTAGLQWGIGSYDLVISPSSDMIRLNPNGSRDATYAPDGVINIGDIRDVLVQSDGKTVVAGRRFGQVGLEYRAVVRLNLDGSLDSTFAHGTTPAFPQPESWHVTRILQQPDEKIVVTGFFTRYSGTARSMITRIQAGGAVDTSFNPGTGANDTILNAALQPDGKIIIAGLFSRFNGVLKSRLARVNADGSLDTTFDVGTGVSTNGVISSIVVQPNGRIVLGGLFTSFNGHATNNLVRLNPDGSVDTSVVSGLGSPEFIRSMLLTTDEELAIGGVFAGYGGVPRDNIAKLKIDDPTGTVFDYDGDGRTDFSVFRPSSGAWYLQRSTAGFQGLQFGADGDKLTPADYDGDGKTDIAVYRPADGRWYILNSATSTVTYPVFGVAEDVSAPGDYDGDGKADLTVFRPSQGTWYRQNSSNGSFFGMQFGATGDVPTVGDFDGDGKNDLGIWRPSNGDWYNIRSSNGSVFGEGFGQTGDKIAPADYDGDGKTDIAIYRPSTGLWVLRNSATATYSYFVFGLPTDVPISGDYDGDGKADIGVWRPSDGTWYISRSDNGQFIVFPWGQNGDQPTPSAYGN